MSLVPKANGKVRLCLGLARLNNVIIMLIDRSPTLNNILLRLTGVKYLTLINASSGYQNLKLDEQYLSLVLLVDKDIYDYHSAWHQLEICSTERKVSCSRVCQHVLHCWWHLDCRVWWHGQRLHYYTEQGAEDVQTFQSKAQQRQVPVQVYKHPILQWGNIGIQFELRP